MMFQATLLTVAVLASRVLIERLVADVGFRPEVGLREGVQAFIAWWRRYELRADPVGGQ